MKEKYILIGFALLVSLFIYLFYRTERTLVTDIFIKMISFDTYLNLKIFVINAFPLNKLIIYSLPEGLWVFCITLTSKPYYIQLKWWYLDGIFIPLVFCFTLELLQLFHVTNGRFDVMDIVTFVLFWILGCLILINKAEKQNFFGIPMSKSFVCLASYCIVYLAHVFN